MCDHYGAIERAFQVGVWVPRGNSNLNVPVCTRVCVCNFLLVFVIVLQECERSTDLSVTPWFTD